MDGLVREVEYQLTRCAWSRSYPISVEVVQMNGSGNFILLRGNLDSFYQKQMAQEAVMRVIRRHENVQLRNEIAVK